MTDWLLYCRVANLLAWIAVAVYMASGAWSAAVGRNTRLGDPMRLACFITALVMIGFVVRWFVFTDSQELWQALYVLSTFVALYIIHLGRAYGRGHRVQ